MANKISIHRALSELKTIGDRIEKATQDLQPVGWQIGKYPVNNQWEREAFQKSATEKFQSVTDLIKRRDSLKAAIVKSNAEKIVTIGGKEMTVAEAIEKKTSIKFQMELLATLTRKHADAVRYIDANNKKVEINALELAAKGLSKSNVKIGDDDVQKIVGNYLENNNAALVDPLGIAKVIDGLSDEIRKFATDVDATLSESNALTLIEV